MSSKDCLNGSRKNSNYDVRCETPVVVLAKKKKKKKDTKKEEDEEEGIDVLPMIGGVAIALVVGAPVYLVSNIKLAMLVMPPLVFPRFLKFISTPPKI